MNTLYSEYTMMRGDKVEKLVSFSVQFILHNCILLEIHHLITYLIIGELISTKTMIFIYIYAHLFGEIW